MGWTKAQREEHERALAASMEVIRQNSIPTPQEEEMMVSLLWIHYRHGRRDLRLKRHRDLFMTREMFLFPLEIPKTGGIGVTIYLERFTPGTIRLASFLTGPVVVLENCDPLQVYARALQLYEALE